MNSPTGESVTVVTVTRNAEAVIEETILSITGQTYQNIEYIIIDGASTDKTVELIRKYDDRISYWVSEPDQGIYFAMNKAIEKATGKWINFMNAGDTFADDSIVEYVMNHKDDTAELLYGNVFLKEYQIVKKAQERSQWYLHLPFCHQALFTRTALIKEELFDTCFRVCADHKFILKMHQAKKRFFYIDKTIAIYTLGGFAESNRLLMNMESLKVLLDMNLPIAEIKNSYWHQELTAFFCSDQRSGIGESKPITEEEETTGRDQALESDLVQLGNDIHTMTQYPLFRHPLKKYRAYRKMLATHHRIRRGNLDQN